MFDAPRVLFVLSAVMILLIIVAAMSYETTWSDPEVHRSIATMEIGGVRADDDAQHWLMGMAFGATTILLLVAALLLASGPSQYALHRTLAVLSGGVIYLAAFVLMMLRYRDYAWEAPSQLGPFTTPTTWMVFGVWGVPVVFAFLYCVKFNTWFGSEDAIQGESKSN